VAGVAGGASSAAEPLFFIDTPFDSPIDISIYTVDPLTGELTLRADLGPAYGPALGLAAADGTVLYAIASDNGQGICEPPGFSCLLLRIALSPFSTVPDSVSVVGPIRVGGAQLADLTGLTFRKDGVLYAIDETTDGLYMIDPASAQAVLVGTANIDLLGGDVTFDADDRLWVWTSAGSAAGLYRMDPATAQCTPVDSEPGLGFSGLAAIGHTNTLYGVNPPADTLYEIEAPSGLDGVSHLLTLGGVRFDHKRGDLDSPFCSSDASCDDGDGCTVNRCTPGGCVFPHVDATCDGIDDDCDGQIDEDFSSHPTTCGVGACIATGSTTCIGGVVGDSCTPAAPAPNDSACNGIDDDCDGQVDEDFAGTPTACGVGACASVGVSTCSAGVLQSTCVPGPPGVEACNGIDDDCDGEIDEGGAALCDDGNTCNGAESCGGGAGCQAGTPPSVATSISVPDGITGESGGTVSVPILAQPATGTTFDLELTYDPAVLHPTGVDLSLSTLDATLTFDLATPGVVRISLAAVAPLSGAGPLAFVRFDVPGTAGAASPLGVTRADVDQGAVSSCRDGGRVDVCSQPGGEVDGVALSGKASTTITWASLGSGVRYDIASGLLSRLHADGSTIEASCLANDRTVASADDSAPATAAGDGYYYLVRPQFACASGSYGHASNGDERWPAAACP
jgi:hypothetical protein